MLEYIRHLEELQFVSAIRENSRLYSFDSGFWRGGGGGGEALKILKTWRGASKIYQYPQQGPCKNMSFFKTSSSPPPRYNKCTFLKCSIACFPSRIYSTMNIVACFC